MPAIHSFDIGLIGCKVLNIRSVCVMLYLGNFPNSPTHKSMEKDCLITEAVFFVALLFYLCYNKDAIKDKTITFLLAEFPSLSGTQGRETGTLFFILHPLFVELVSVRSLSFPHNQHRACQKTLMIAFASAATFISVFLLQLVSAHASGTL